VWAPCNRFHLLIKSRFISFQGISRMPVIMRANRVGSNPAGRLPALSWVRKPRQKTIGETCCDCYLYANETLKRRSGPCCSCAADGQISDEPRQR
jgi:hypothetical protein